jgi:hypothetical protein
MECATSRPYQQAGLPNRQVYMDDKIFASARMTVALDEDQSAYDAIPAVNIFDGDLNLSRPTNAIVQGSTRPRRWLNRLWIPMMLLVAVGLFLAACQGAGY